MYLIIVGLDSVGRNLVELAWKNKHNIAVIDKNPALCREVANKYDVLTIAGDATTRRILQEAGASRADALITTTNNDGTNFMICLLAKELGIKTTASILINPEHSSMFGSASVMLVGNPELEVAKHLYWTVERPHFKELYRFRNGQVEMFEVGVGEGSEAINKPLSEIKMANGGLVVAIERKNKIIIPKGDTKIIIGDKVTIFAHHGSAEKIAAIFTRKK